VLRSLDGGAFWSRSFATGLPNTEVRDLELVPGLNTLVAGTFGRGAFELRVPPFDTSPPDLVADDDSGVSSADDLTNVRRPRFTGTGWPSAVRVELLEGINVIGSGSVDPASGAWSAQVTADLSEGTHAIRARVVHPLGHLSPESLPITIAIDTTAPPAPSVPDLEPASDTGVASDDNVTSNSAPVFGGTAVPGGIITVVTDLAGPVGSVAAPDTTWRVAVEPLAEGVHRVSATATDAAGNTSVRSAELLVTIDTTPPFSVPSVPDLLAASDSGSSNTDNITADRTPTFAGLAPPGSNVVVLANGNAIGWTQADSAGLWSFTGTADLADGLVDVAARLMDDAGNLGPFSGPLTITIDTFVSAPSVPDLVASNDTGVSDADDITRDNTPEFVGSAEPGSSVTLVSDLAGVIGMGTADAFGAWTLTAVELANGTHQLSTVATDRAGNVSSASQPLLVVVDTAAPAAPTAPDMATASDSGVSPSDNVTNHRTPFFTGTAPVGVLLTVSSSLDGVLTTLPVGASGTWSFTSRTLREGVHAIVATAADLAGNQSAPSPTLLVTIDSTAPASPTQPDLAAASDSGASDVDNVTRESRPLFGGAAESATLVTLFVDDLPVNSTTADASGAWSLTSTTLADGVHAIAARASDAAGNSSALSAALTILIDSTVPTPTTPDLDAASDSGVSTFDDLTNATTLHIAGTVEPLSTVTIFVGATAIGVAAADTGGMWSFAVGPFGEGVHSLSVRATDRAGNESTASGMLVVQIDLSPPEVPAPPALVDDTGVAGDNRTNVRRPSFTGIADPLARVELAIGNELIGSGAADADGDYVVAATRDLGDGAHAIAVRAIDAAGNASTSTLAFVFVDATPPQALALSPTGQLTVSTSSLVVLFNDDDLVDTGPGDPRFASSVVNPANFSLVGAGDDGTFGNGNDRVIALAASEFSYDTASDRLDVSLRDAAGSPLILPNDQYRFVVNGVTSVTDMAGNRLSGGDFVGTFSVAVPSPRVVDVTMVDTRKSVARVIVSFTESLDAAAAASLTHFQFFAAGRDKRFGTPDDVPLGMGTPLYDAAARTVTLRPTNRFATGRLVRLVVRDTLLGAAQVPLDGNSDGTPGGDWIAEIGRGRTFSYQEADGDTVNLFVLGSGTMELIRLPGDAGPRVRLANVVSGVTTLTGGHRRARSSDGQAILQNVSPASVIIRLPTTFRITEPPLAARLVDEVLESPLSF
jgi:hypothetical protein